MTFLKNIFSRIKEINNAKVGIIDYYLVAISSFIFSLMIVSGPIAICINLLILVTNLRIFISFILAIIFGIFMYFLVYFYSNSITKGSIDGIKSVSLFFGIISIIFGIIFVIILICAGVY